MEGRLSSGWLVCYVELSATKLHVVQLYNTTMKIIVDFLYLTKLTRVNQPSIYALHASQSVFMTIGSGGVKLPIP